MADPFSAALISILGPSGAAATGTAAATAATAGTAATSATVFGMTTSGLLSAGFGGLSALSSIGAGNAARGEANFQAKLAEVAATGKEVERRRRLVTSLATQFAGRGASGITMEGTPQVSLKDTIRQSELDKLTIKSNLASRQGQLSASGSNAAKRGRINAGASILNSLSDISARGKI